MSRKARSKVPLKKRAPGQMHVVVNSEADRATALAQTMLQPTLQAGYTVYAFNDGHHNSDLEINALVAELERQSESANHGDLKRAEAMLIAQAHSLDAIFSSLARRALVQNQLSMYEAHLRLALKAQNQCRATLETLATIKYPPVIYASQANVTTGPQQVNNGAPSRARETDVVQSKLSEGENELRADTRAPAVTSRADKEVETLGKIHRTKNRSR
jgi:hypothetical protein